MKGRSITQILGIDLQAIYMTMLGLVALYLILTHASQLNALLKTGFGGGLEGLVILQGRNLKTAGVRAV
jgi:hypothetical protein